ncbi:MAG: hypothetical protein A2Y97_13655 [Nitrospirae bacterium RBG_13_39_12]|nr:MAG: hypothetical protein A2Y97_13655 [Nitrospirae bacterium RBG_13_39_12]
MSITQVSIINSIKNLLALDSSVTDKGQENIHIENVRAFLKDLSAVPDLKKFYQEHLLGPYVYHNLKKLQGNENISDEVLAQFENEYYLTAVSNIEKLYASANIFQAFKKENIFGIPLKGVALIETLYRNPAIRPMADIDILVKPDDCQKVRHVLGGLGYQLFESYRGSYNFINSENKPVLDLHTRFTRYEMLFNIDYSEIYRRLRQINFNDQIRLKVFSPEHQLIHLALHLAPGLYSDLNFLNLFDLYHMLKNKKILMDWEYVGDFAMRSGTSSYIYAPLYICEKIFRAGVPAQVLIKLGSELSGKRINYLENHYLAAILDKNNTGTKIFLERLVWAEGFLKKLKLIRTALFPERREIADRFNIPENSPRLYGLYMSRLWKILKKAEARNKKVRSK